MGEIRLDCPHPDCRTRGAAFKTVWGEPLAHQRKASEAELRAGNKPTIRWNVFAICTQCHRGIALLLEGKSGQAYRPADWTGSDFGTYFDTLACFPQPQTVLPVDNLPTTVAKALTEAEQNFDDKRWSSAAIQYRRAVERSLKTMDPPPVGRSLYDRIEALSASLPRSLIALLHQVRFLGNDGAHDDDPDRADVEAGREFVMLFLTYMHDLPKRIAEAQDRRESRKGR